jgi:dihydrofolate reductase
MRKIIVFNHVSLDGYFVGANGDSSWAHKNNEDPEFAKWQKNNAGSEAQFLFGRVTYELMAGYWPTAQAKQQNPEIADAMNKMPKVVFSKTLDKVSWNNTKLLKGSLVSEIKKLKSESGPDILIFGSGQIIAQLAQEKLIEVYTVILNPIVLGKGRTMFEGLSEMQDLKLTNSKTFKNGKTLLNYEAA